MTTDDNSKYWWDLQLLSCGNRYSKVTWDAALNRIEYHNKALYKCHWTRFSWENNGDIIKILADGKPIASLKKVGEIENPETVYRWYRE